MGVLSCSKLYLPYIETDWRCDQLIKPQEISHAVHLRKLYTQKSPTLIGTALRVMPNSQMFYLATCQTGKYSAQSPKKVTDNVLNDLSIAQFPGSPTDIIGKCSAQNCEYGESVVNSPTD